MADNGKDGSETSLTVMESRSAPQQAVSGTNVFTVTSATSTPAFVGAEHSTVLSSAALQGGSRRSTISSRSSLQTEDNVHLPPDFKISPLLLEILEEPLPPMELLSPYMKPEEEVEDVVLRIDETIRKKPTYLVFLAEIRNLLTYVLQERKRRKILQDQLKNREAEIQNLRELYKKDPRVSKVLMLAEHWRVEKDRSGEVIESLQNELSSVTSDMRGMEINLVAMQKRMEKMEKQILRSKTADLERDLLEEQLLSRDKAISVMKENEEMITAKLRNTEQDMEQKELEYKIKLEMAPDRNAYKLSLLHRELEMMSLEKEAKMLEARDLQYQVSAAIGKDMTSTNRLKLLAKSVKELKAQEKSLEDRYNKVLIQNKQLKEHLDVKIEHLKAIETGTDRLEKENKILKKHLASAQRIARVEEGKAVKARDELSKVQLEKVELKAKNDEASLTINTLMIEKRDVQTLTAKKEVQVKQALELRRRETQKVSRLQQKLDRDKKHIQSATYSIRRLSDQMGQAGSHMKMLDLELLRCKSELARNYTTVEYLNRLLDSSEDMVRIQMKENDALIISKGKMAKTLRICNYNKIKLTDEVARIHTAKNTLEDTLLAQKFILDFIENERDGARRNFHAAEERIILMTKKQMTKLAQLARCNSETSNLSMKIHQLHSDIKVQKKEIQSLSKALQTAQQKTQQTLHGCNVLKQQRDLFGTRVLQQKNEAEMSSMHMDMLHHLLDKMSTSHRDKCNDITVLKKEILNLRRKVKALEHFESLCKELRGEVAYLSRGIALESNKRAALEHMRQQNVHRRRDMEFKEPSKYELILKVQRMQKLLIRKINESSAKEQELAMKTDHIQQLKVLVKRRENEINASSKVKTVVQDKNKKIKSLMAEVNMLNYFKDVSCKVNEEQREELGTVKDQLLRLRQTMSAKQMSAAETATKESKQQLGSTLSIRNKGGKRA